MKSKTKKRRLQQKEDALTDERFRHLKTDAKFTYSLPKKETKNVIDNRFTEALKGERFQNRAKVDRYGRVLKIKSSVADEMGEMYNLNPNDEVPVTKSPEKSEENAKPKKAFKTISEEGHSNSEPENSDDDDDFEFKLDLARGHAELLSSSGDSSDSETEEKEIEDNEEWVELDKDARRVEWASYRLAICNLDWDNLNSEDLFILCRSFVKDSDSVQSLTIYLSDFGKERLAAEETVGPSVIVNEDEDLDERWHGDAQKKKANIAIRQYEIDRLRYYYAVLVCDSTETATVIYEQCDGHEYENSGMRIDMRFIPDSMEFETSRIKEKVTGDQIRVENYRPKEFINKAISMSSAEITWDENNPDRIRKIKDAFEEEKDFEKAAHHDLIASSEEESSDGEEVLNRDERIMILMQAAGLEQREKELEIEWEPPDAHDASDASDREDSNANLTDESDRESIMNEQEDKQPTKKQKWKAYLERRSALRKERKRAIRENKEAEKLTGLISDDQIKKSKKSKKSLKITDDDASLVATDPRFSSLFTDSAFAIEKSSKELKDSSLIVRQVDARKAMMLEQDKKAKAGNEHAKARSEGQELIEKLKRKSISRIGGFTKK